MSNFNQFIEDPQNKEKLNGLLKVGLTKRALRLWQSFYKNASDWQLQSHKGRAEAEHTNDLLLKIEKDVATQDPKLAGNIKKIIDRLNDTTEEMTNLHDYMSKSIMAHKTFADLMMHVVENPREPLMTQIRELIVLNQLHGILQGIVDKGVAETQAISEPTPKEIQVTNKDKLFKELQQIVKEHESDHLLDEIERNLNLNNLQSNEEVDYDALEQRKEETALLNLILSQTPEDTGRYIALNHIKQRVYPESMSKTIFPLHQVWNSNSSIAIASVMVDAIAKNDTELLNNVRKFIGLAGLKHRIELIIPQVTTTIQQQRVDIPRL